jgi:hypothetical protein
MSSCKVRYGNNYKIVLAIVLPMLLTVYPFILLMQGFSTLNIWQFYLIIYLFLGFVILFTLWLVKKIYTTVIVSINNTEIKIEFLQKNLFSPSDFTLKTHEIKSVSCKNTLDFKSLKNGSIVRNISNGDSCLIVKTSIKPSKFQLSAFTYTLEDQNNFDKIVSEIAKFAERKVY